MEGAQRQSLRLQPYHNFSFEMFLSKNEEIPGNDLETKECGNFF